MVQSAEDRREREREREREFLCVFFVNIEGMNFP
jgi:hypothetical protein